MAAAACRGKAGFLKGLAAAAHSSLTAAAGRYSTLARVEGSVAISNTAVESSSYMFKYEVGRLAEHARALCDCARASWLTCVTCVAMLWRRHARHQCAGGLRGVSSSRRGGKEAALLVGNSKYSIIFI